NTQVSPTSCCRHNWENIQAEKRGRVEALLTSDGPFSSPRPRFNKALNSSDKLSKVIKTDINRNLRIQAPLSTTIIIKIKNEIKRIWSTVQTSQNFRFAAWHISRQNGGYHIRQIFDILREFGRIESLYVVSENSARATFVQLEAACSAVNARFLGNAHNPMLCDWFHKTMLNKSFTIRRRHLYVNHDPFIG
ncbi:uncharacterized protein LOC117104547, partial [Anneissia japonica]|uniref:uncharacterized protein LOC117104547 n=1 Tax=Anneissia japonica TaxID=1529436 RepID=UPI0014259B80